MASFSKKLCKEKQRYSYDLEFYVAVQTLCYWKHKLIAKETVLFSDREALKHLHS